MLKLFDYVILLEGTEENEKEKQWIKAETVLVDCGTRCIAGAASVYHQ